MKPSPMFPNGLVIKAACCCPCLEGWNSSTLAFLPAQGLATKLTVIVLDQGSSQGGTYFPH